MKHPLPISIALALTFGVPVVNALEVVSIAETGGTLVHTNEVIVSGTSSASAEIRTILRGGIAVGSIDVQLRTERDGVLEDVTRHYEIPLQQVAEVEAVVVSAEDTVNASLIEQRDEGFFERVAGLFTKLVRFVFVFW